ncbi:hypothetical protein ABFS82_11G122500 [Erythranthe guttata]|nr:PREDICTED: pentatricopeptide repeat-containing protein At5g15280 [Erythranthe guttata]|eukprot:XP_012840466.1 PREDICTED: pentatricopeptide repeat-containing protein At5g15280 [Erythranthe guttata]
MFQTLSRLSTKDSHHHHRIRVCSILTQFINFCADSSIKPPNTPVTNQTHKNSPSINLSGIARTAKSKCSPHHLSLKDYLLRLSNISPEIIRRFWRVSELKPQNVLEILVGFESDSGKYEVEVEKVESLWGIFKWASGQTREFEHFPMSCKIMASMLVRAGFFIEVECLLSRSESRGILLDCDGVFGNLIEGYLKEFELDRAISAYERMRGLALVPSLSSYRALVKYLVGVDETQLMYRVYLDMINNKVGIGGSVEEDDIHESVVRMLCIDGKVQEARNLVKEFLNYGVRPSDLVVNAISCGYCNKKDYDDLLRFFAEVKVAPDALIGNKILFSLCRDYGVDEASIFLQKLEEIGFCPNEIAFGILIGSSCLERKLKNALFYVSDILSSGLKPHLYSYNALLSAMFEEGMSKHAREILVEMSEMGVTPNLSTYKILVAGFCRARQFDEVKAIVCEMSDNDLVKISSLEDPLTKGFMLLGLSQSEVKIRRDNDKGFSKTEFYDNLGNGLYLDTNLDEYENKITRVLDNSMLLDFNSVIIENLEFRDVESSLVMVDETAKWGQELSLNAVSCLLSRLCRDSLNVETINCLLEAMSKSIYQLDRKTLNMLVQTFGKTGFTFRARTLFDGMMRRGYNIDNDTYSALLFDACKRGDSRSFRKFFSLARESNWSPEEKDGNALVVSMCKNKWFDEACALLEEFSTQAGIFDHMAYSCLVSGFCREKRFAKALGIFENMLFRKLSPPVEMYARLISRICRTNFEKAIELKNTCSMDNQPSALLPIDCALIKGLCKSKRFQEANILFEQVLFKGFVPNSDVFNALIEGYCGERNFKKVKEFLCFMIRKNLRFSISTYGNILRMACKKGNFFLAMRSKELMLRITEFPEIVLYNILIFHISSTKNSSVLDSMIEELRKKGLQFDDVTYNYVIRGFLLCNDISCSLHYLRNMLRQDLKPSNRSLREIIIFLCRNLEVELALELSREMELRGWIFGSVIQSSIVEALLGKGTNVNKAVEFLDRIASKSLIPENVNYDYLIKRFYEHGRVDKAVELLNVMLRKGGGGPPESTSYDYIIQGLCKDYCNLDKALDFYGEMLCRGLKPSVVTWNILVCGLSEFGRVEEAEELLRSMIESGEIPSRRVFNAVIDKYRSDKNFGKTFEIVNLMQEKGYVPDFETHWSLVSNLSDSRKKDGGKTSKGFLSNLLEGFGFSAKKIG